MDEYKEATVPQLENGDLSGRVRVTGSFMGPGKTENGESICHLVGGGQSVNCFAPADICTRTLYEITGSYDGNTLHVHSAEMVSGFDNQRTLSVVELYSDGHMQKELNKMREREKHRRLTD
jgi:hypothetical protein